MPPGAGCAVDSRQRPFQQPETPEPAAAGTNTHTQAKTGKVITKRDGNQVRVDVQDDGIGFETAQIGVREGRGSGFGFFSIRERLEPLGGRILTDSKVGHGTRVILLAPLV